MTKNETYARRCDVTGQGMNTGFCIRDGAMYIKSEKHLSEHITNETDYASVEDAYEDDYYYYTEWQDFYDHQFKVVGDELIEIEEPLTPNALWEIRVNSLRQQVVLTELCNILDVCGFAVLDHGGYDPEHRRSSEAFVRWAVGKYSTNKQKL